MTSDIIEEIKKQNFPPSQFIVVGGGILAVKNIRPNSDIDLVVTPKLFNALRQEGWDFEVVTLLDGRTRERISKGSFEAFKDFWHGKGVEEFDKNPQWTETIKGIRFISLGVVLQTKQMWRREKDLHDIELITQYFENNLKKTFPIVYRWTDAPNTPYKEHSHKGRVAFYVTKGLVTFDFTGTKKTISTGEYVDVPVATPHTAIVGEEGCEYVIGQEIEGDA